MEENSSSEYIRDFGVVELDLVNAVDEGHNGVLVRVCPARRVPQVVQLYKLSEKC